MQVTSLEGHYDSTLPTSNVWTIQQNSTNHAYSVTIPSVTVNNNNKNNTYAVLPVAEFLKLKTYFDAEEDCYSNKKRRMDAARFHHHLALIFDLIVEIENGTYSPDKSICFVLNYPRYREVFAASYRDRITHHLVAPFIQQVTEAVHNSNGNISHGNRRGLSAHTAALQIQGYIREMPDGIAFSQDVSGFFMNIVRQMAYDNFVNFCNKFRPKGYTDEQVDKMLKIIYILITNDPSKNCERRSPLSAWDNIAKNKTLFGNENGLPIGNFYSQLLANLYLAIWGMAIILLRLNVKITQFVDDMGGVAKTIIDVRIVRQVSDEVLKSQRLKLHPDKFYVQPVRHGLEFCGRYIFKDRIYISNRSVRAAKASIRNAIIAGATEENARKLACSLNAYTGIMCHCATFNIQMRLMNLVLDSDYREYLYFELRPNESHLICLVKDKYNKQKKIERDLQEIKQYHKQQCYEYKKHHTIPNGRTKKHSETRNSKRPNRTSVRVQDPIR